MRTACLLIGWFVLQSQSIAAPPNVLLIVSDDQGYGDLGCYGSKEAQTPHLDRLASEGARLTNFYVAWPACTPSRASLLTGRYPQRHGLYDMIRNEAPDYGKRYTPAEYAVTFERIAGMDTREILIANMLSNAGYACGMFGKWDLGMQQRFLPLARGFGDFYGFVNTGIDYFTHERYGVPSMYRNNQPTTEDRGAYTTDLFEREALRFIDENRERPFFMYLSFNAPHSASNLDPEIRRTVQAPQEAIAHYVKSQPNLSPRRRSYLAAISCMDDAIGELLAQLDELELTENTLVIFLSDNGGGGIADNGPFRGGKAQLNEGGIRVPCILRYPRAIEPGSESDEFLSALEIVPTILGVTGVAPPNNLILDGYDMLPVLAEGNPSTRTSMCWQRRDEKAIRSGNWKWIQTAKGTFLYDLEKDPAERQNLAGERSDLADKLEDQFARWEAEMQAAEPRGPFRDY